MTNPSEPPKLAEKRSRGRRIFCCLVVVLGALAALPCSIAMLPLIVKRGGGPAEPRDAIKVVASGADVDRVANAIDSSRGRFVSRRVLVTTLWAEVREIPQSKLAVFERNDLAIVLADEPSSRSSIDDLAGEALAMAQLETFGRVDLDIVTPRLERVTLADGSSHDLRVTSGRVSPSGARVQVAGAVIEPYTNDSKRLVVAAVWVEGPGPAGAALPDAVRALFAALSPR